MANSGLSYLFFCFLSSHSCLSLMHSQLQGLPYLHLFSNCLSISLLSLAPACKYSGLSVSFSHPHVSPQQGHPLHQPISRDHLLHWCTMLFIVQTSFNRHTPSPPLTPCFLYLRWRHLETSLTSGRQAAGSWRFSGGFWEPFHKGSRKPVGLMDCWSQTEFSQLFQAKLLPTCTHRKGLHLSKEEGTNGWR